VRKLLADVRAAVHDEPGTLQWFVYELEDKEDGAPGGFCALATFADTGARNVHLAGAFPKALAENTSLFQSGPDMRPVEIMRSRVMDCAGRELAHAARIFITAKPKLVKKIKSALTVLFLWRVACACKQTDFAPSRRASITRT
jgi:hypothetical protein